MGSLWYDSNNSNLNIWFVDLNGGQWISVVPYPQDNITQNGGVFEGAIYAQYEIPNNPSTFATTGWVRDNLDSFLSSQGYVRSGNGIVTDSAGLITTIDAGLII
jgi:hypothetical protein